MTSVTLSNTYDIRFCDGAV